MSTAMEAGSVAGGVAPARYPTPVRAAHWLTVLAVAAAYLLGLHIAASLWHHFVVRANTLRRML